MVGWEYLVEGLTRKNRKIYKLEAEELKKRRGRISRFYSEKPLGCSEPNLVSFKTLQIFEKKGITTIID
jgi:hypothetical protein